MRPSILWLGLVACKPLPSVHDPVTVACDPGRIRDVWVEGASRAALAQLTVLEGTLDDAPRTERVAATATEGLRGYGFANATLAISRTTTCGVDLHVAVTLGPRFKIAQIEFATTDDFPQAERLAAIEDTLGTVNVVGGVYLEDRLLRALDELRNRYRDAGWLDVAIAAPKASYDEQGAVAITIPIEPGERFKIGTVRASGGNRTARVAALEAIGLHGGEWYDGATIRTGIERASHELDRKIVLRTEVVKPRRVIDVLAVVDEVVP
jgi:outer membrane protein assembly factor BamA